MFRGLYGASSAMLIQEKVIDVASLEQLEVRPDSVARVVVNERTGTVVMGGNVKISAVAVSHGNLTVAVAEAPQVVQPEPFAGGQTAVVPRTGVAVEEQQGRRNDEGV
ncbi:MAG: flagellar basal body P-ring protein FlgI [Acetomicrobium sp.]